MPRARIAGAFGVAAVLLALAAAPGSGATRGHELAVSVAISMKDAVEALGRRFTAAHADVVLRYNVGASGVLATQIAAGAPVDVFVSAGQTQMDELEKRGLLVSDTRRAFARNVLVVVVPAGIDVVEIHRPDDLLGGRASRVAIGNPRTVPAGQYAEESLRALGLLDRLRPRLVYGENVREVLEWVARGEVDAGWVYATDVGIARGRVREAFRPPAETYRAIVYPAAVVRQTREPELARAFVALLASADGASVLERFGFLPAR